MAPVVRTGHKNFRKIKVYNKQMLDIIKQICIEYTSDTLNLYKTYLVAKLFQNYIYICFLQNGNPITGRRDPIKIRDFKECDTEDLAMYYLNLYYEMENKE